MAITVRTATAADAQQIAALVQELVSESGESSPITPPYVEEYLRFPGSAALVAEEDRQIVGLLAFSVRPGLFHAGNSTLIEELVVTRRARGHGVGGTLIDALLARLEAEGCAEVSVTTMPGNAGALRFYKSHGLVDEAVYLEKHFRE